jgi:hypothetical protein
MMDDIIGLGAGWLGAVLLVLLLVACTEQTPAKKGAPSDDGCVGYIIKPDGSKQCLGRGG